MTRAWPFPAFLGAATMLAACSAVLGLDPPTLAPCDGGCGDDASPPSDAGSGGDAADGSADASEAATVCLADAMPDAPPPGIQCGGGCFPITYCTGSTPVCCQRTDDAGTTTYACTTSESACDGYPIACANDDDCPGSEICCHFGSKMTCDSTTSCASNELVCRPNVPVDCPTGKKCDVPAKNAGVVSPYLLCEP